MVVLLALSAVKFEIVLVLMMLAPRPESSASSVECSRFCFERKTETTMQPMLVMPVGAGGDVGSKNWPKLVVVMLAWSKVVTVLEGTLKKETNNTLMILCNDGW